MSEGAPTRKTDHPETRLQVAILRFMREQVLDPHDTLAFDRSKAQSARQHMHEAQRGIRRGTADLLVEWAAFTGRCNWWVEAKAEKGVVSDSQRDFGARRAALGHAWHVIRSVTQLFELLRYEGVKTSNTAGWAAAAADAKLQGARARAVGPQPARKPRAPRPEVSGEDLARASRERLQGWLDEG